MYLGLDIGTSSVKAVLIDDGGGIVASTSSPFSVSRPHPNWSEQEAGAWTDGVEKALAGLARDHRTALAAVRGIGLSGHMHGATLLDAADRPLRPCILWNDGRSHKEAAELDADPRFRALTGNIVFPGFTAPKLVWVARHEPEIFAATRWVLLPKDYVRLWLTGEHASEMSDSAGTAWLDVGARAWSPELLAATGMRQEQMPFLFEGIEATGTVRPELAERWGMGRDVVVAGGAGDNAASACGVGVVTPGSAFVSLGTSGVLFVSTDRFNPNAASAVHTFCHAIPDTWHQMGVILSATASLEWLALVTGRSAAELTTGLGALTPPSRVRFLPYLSGERTPHNDAGARGAFVGLDHEADAGVLTRAVLEGVAFALADSQQALAQCGTSLGEVTAVGGGSRSRTWLSLIATVLGVPVDVPAEGDFGAGLGAARLGLMAATGARPRDICTRPALADTIEPEAGLVSAYREAHRRWQALYPAIKGVYP